MTREEELIAKIKHLVYELERIHAGECVVARPGEGTYECSVHVGANSQKCLACKLRNAEEEIAVLKERLLTALQDGMF